MLVSENIIPLLQKEDQHLCDCTDTRRSAHVCAERGREQLLCLQQTVSLFFLVAPAASNHSLAPTTTGRCGDVIHSREGCKEVKSICGVHLSVWLFARLLHLCLLICGRELGKALRWRKGGCGLLRLMFG